MKADRRAAGAACRAAGRGSRGRERPGGTIWVGTRGWAVALVVLLVHPRQPSRAGSKRWWSGPACAGVAFGIFASWYVPRLNAAGCAPRPRRGGQGGEKGGGRSSQRRGQRRLEQGLLDRDPGRSTRGRSELVADRPPRAGGQPRRPWLGMRPGPGRGRDTGTRPSSGAVRVSRRRRKRSGRAPRFSGDVSFFGRQGRSVGTHCAGAACAMGDRGPVLGW